MDRKFVRDYDKLIAFIEANDEYDDEVPEGAFELMYDSGDTVAQLASRLASIPGTVDPLKHKLLWEYCKLCGLADKIVNCNELYVSPSASSSPITPAMHGEVING